MFDVAHIENYKILLQEWLSGVQNRIQKECKDLKKYQKTEEAIDQLVAALQKNSFTNKQIDDIYSSICEYQTFAANTAYILGLRDGLEVQKLIENISVKDIIKNIV